MSMYAVDNDNHRIVGVCGLTNMDLINRRAEFSLYVADPGQGKGYGEAALRALIAKGFNTYGLNCIWGEVFEGNPAIAMFERVGFKPEGRRREFYFREGRFIDAILISLLRSEHA
jgi:RimJ/RimL family protein N-acetyltransferase